MAHLVDPVLSPAPHGRCRPMTPSVRSGPLSSVRVIELAGLGPCPFAAMVLADLGADVLRLERPDAVLDPPHRSTDVLQRNKRSVGVDLKNDEGVAFVLDLVSRADVLLEGFRPGVAERLGLGPVECLEVNPRLVYGRITGYGQSGPLSSRPGHDIDFIALSGVLSTFGREAGPPVPPCNLVGDFGGGGMLLALGVAASLVSVARGGSGEVIDAAMVDGSALLSAMLWGLRAAGFWQDGPGSNLLDTGAPFYEVYECKDGRHIAVGAIEPRFFSALTRLVGLPEEELPPRMDRARWPETKERLAAIFRTRTRDEWIALSEEAGGDECLAPVLSMEEAATHPHNVARGTFTTVDGLTQPAPAPRFRAQPPPLVSPPCRPGEGGREALAEWGVPPETLDLLAASGAIRVLGQGGAFANGR